MDHSTLKQDQKLGPFEIKDFVAKVASKAAQEASISYLNAGRGNPNWVATEPREAYFLLGQFAVTESKRVLDLPPGVGGMPKAAGIAGRLEAWVKKQKQADMPGASLLEAMVPWTRDEVRLRPRQVRARTGGFDHRRPLPGPRPHAGAQRTDRAGVPAVGDVRKAAAERHVQALCGRGRHRRHVLHLQVAEEQPHSQSRRHDCARRADLHAVPRDGASGGLRPPFRRSARDAGEPVSVPGRRARQAARPEDQGVLHRQPGQPVRGGTVTRNDREDRGGAQEAAGSHPADR